MFTRNEDGSFSMFYEIVMNENEKEFYYAISADFEEIEIKRILKTLEYWENEPNEFKDYKVSNKYFCSQVGKDFFMIKGSKDNIFNLILGNENSIREFKERIEIVLAQKK
ncbi:hypothetical protein [Francisella philomiragia]|uniref:hypothetical protein n=1 Tax=Francisella philomiragia TaxID=28110 RepID=UPI0019068D20|nr:hypothetical protein [Francisella philomiragia]MBK2257600.1 hypothetical protein [Francisella philomiragia]MBK2270314.1 hypothetical protein [Francisella philomiragia]MBK2272134.1 hypothetical protein [Francisella philomiragia]MBK2275978.1 hypothetical protein [Francisella philomiragia]MBK2295515.1 hypothetical protein [Francisella philomiragia]